MSEAALKRPAPYRIKDLVRLTGITKETIHYYITEGLLPRALKTARNMAWYGDEHIDRIKLIKELQEKQFLPLKAIKAVLTDGKGYAFTPAQQRTIALVQARMAVERAVAGGDGRLKLADVAARYAVTEQDVADFEAAGLVHADRTGPEPLIDAEDEAYFRTWAAMRDVGLTRERGFGPADLEMYEHVAAIMFDQGLRLLSGKMEELAPEQAERMIFEALPLVNELVGRLHTKKVRQFITDFRAKGES